MENRKIHFEDHGQEFLAWEVDAQGTIVNCEPFVRNWIGHRVLSPRTVRKGHLVNVKSRHRGDVFTIIYPVERIQVLPPASYGAHA